RVSGQLWLGSMPGRFESWAAFMAEARQRRLGLVVCLAPADEVASLAPAYWQAIVEGSLDFRFLHLPMQNYGLPRELAAFRDGIAQTAASLRAGDSVLLHCAAGIGRTGTAAACLLKALGLPTEEAMQRVLDAGSNPQNALQSGLVNGF
ncbi:MAG TPA: tyrosine-protein phosphatase, partial [Albitalea sp.]|nr:tyrosine-protein phosphatase [Albitalea sp.]